MKNLLLLLAVLTLGSCAAPQIMSQEQKAKWMEKKGLGASCAINIHKNPMAIGTQYQANCLSGVYLLKIVEASSERIVYKYGNGNNLRYFYFTTDLVLFRIDRGAPKKGGGKIIVNQYN